MAIRLENDFCGIDFDPVNGAVTSLFDKAGGIELIAEPRLADNFRLLLPLPDLHGNYVEGKEQRLTHVEEDEAHLTLRWDGPLTNARGDYDVSVTMTIVLSAPAVTFRLEVENRTDLELAEAWYPILGGLLGLGDERVRRDTCLMVANDLGDERNVFRRFGATNELGTPLPEWLFTYPTPLSMPWCDLFNRRLGRGLYFASHDTLARFKGVRLALYPGSGRGRVNDDWPRPGEVDAATPVGVIANWFHFPYTPPGGRFDGSTIVVQFHDGDWRQAAAVYREWFTSRFPLVDPRKSWMRRDMTAFQDTMFMLPEGNVTVTFSEIPRWARDARNHGVRHVLISGWNVGGHDGGYPQYEPDPRLGTWEELETGIRACHEMDVKVFLFVNIHPADTAIDWYKNELHRYAVLNPWGDRTAATGWGMGTLGARLGLTHPTLERMGAGVPQVRDIFVRQMRRLAEIGADGVHIDKCHPFGLDFNPLAEGGPDRADWEGTLRCVETMLDTCREVNPEFSLSAESAWDRILSYTDVTWWAPIDRPSLMKFTFPQWLPARAVNQPFAYNVVNEAVYRGWGLLVGPGNYTASMADPLFAPLAAYIKEVQRIRQELKDTLFLGELLDPPSVLIEGPFAGSEYARLGLFRNSETGQCACVLANLGDEPLETVFGGFDANASGCVYVYQPFEPRREVKLPFTTKMAPERFVVLVER